MVCTPVLGRILLPSGPANSFAPVTWWFSPPKPCTIRALNIAALCAQNSSRTLLAKGKWSDTLDGGDCLELIWRVRVALCCVKLCTRQLFRLSFASQMTRRLMRWWQLAPTVHYNSRVRPAAVSSLAHHQSL